jgi:hypothetical protein
MFYLLVTCTLLYVDIFRETTRNHKAIPSVTMADNMPATTAQPRGGGITIHCHSPLAVFQVRQNTDESYYYSATVNKTLSKQDKRKKIEPRYKNNPQNTI